MKHLLENIKSIRLEIESLSSMKKNLQEKIAALEVQEQALREEILSNMIQKNKRYEQLDGLAEVKVQKTARAYETVDESALFDFLRSMGRYDDVVKTTTKISSAPLTKFLDELRSADALPPCVRMKESEDSLRITFEGNKSSYAKNEVSFPSSRKVSAGEWMPDDADSLDGV